MIDFKSEEKLAEILDKFDVPKLNFVRHIDAGPDDDLYWYLAEDGTRYGVWRRDYMSELKYEKAGLEKEYNIKIEKWIKKKQPSEKPVFIYDDEYLYECGDRFAVFKVAND